MAKVAENWVCPQCGARMDIAPLGLYAEVQCPHCMYTDIVHFQVGNFRLEGVLGVGGMSVVYRAIDVVLNRPLAIKVLNDTFRDQPERIERFENEAAMMSRVRHENVTSVYSAGRAYGQFYIAMELVEGTNLEHMVTQEEPMNPREALTIIRSVAQGLEAAHKAGLLHRDMKPGNILITASGQAKVIDFGLAVDSQEGDTEEIIWATPYYVPPETLQRKPEDVRTDIYALGMTLRYLLTGVESFEGPTDSLSALIVCKRKQLSFAKQCPHMLPALCELVDHMTKFSPSDRPENYSDLIEEIDEVQQALAKQELLDIDPVEDKRNRLRQTMWAIVGSVALGVMLAAYLHPTHVTINQEYASLVQVNDSSEAINTLDKALNHLERQETHFACMSLLDLAQRANESTIGAWSALLASLVMEATDASPDDIQKAKQLFTKHRNNLSNVSASGKAFFDNMADIDRSGLPPTAEAWSKGNTPWTELTAKGVNSKIEALTRADKPAALKAVEWYILALQSQWVGDKDAFNRCMAQFSATIAAAGPYAALGNVLNTPSNKLLKGPASLTKQTSSSRPAQDFEKAEQLMRKHALQEAQAIFAALAKNSALSPEERTRSGVLAEVCQVGQAIIQMLNRRYPGKYKPGMSADEMANLIPMQKPEIRAVKSDSYESSHPDQAAVDGDPETRWCASDRGTGHYLTINLKEPVPVGFMEILWEKSKPQKANIVAADSQGVYNLSIDKNDYYSIVDFKGKKIQTIRITVTSTEKGTWASIREINLFHKDDFLKREVTIVGLLLEGKYDAAWSKLHELLRQDRPNPYFNTIAEDWMNRWIGDTKSAPRNLITEASIMKTYREKSEDLGKLIELCRNCLHVTVKPDKTIDFEKNFTYPDPNRWWRVPSLTPGQGMMCPIPIAKELEKRGRVTVSNESVVAVLGLRESRYRDFTLIPGYIQPCRLQDAQYFENRGDGKILFSEKDLEGLRDSLKEHPYIPSLKRMVERL